MVNLLALDIKVTGDRRTITAVNAWMRELEDWTPVWALIEADFYRMEQEQWASEGSRGGDKWPPLSPAYAAWKARRYPGQPLMVATGALRDSMTKQGATGQVRVIDKFRMELGTEIEYGVYHQYGGGDLPQRKIMAVTDKDVERWRGFAEMRAVEAARKVGLV